MPPQGSPPLVAVGAQGGTDPREEYLGCRAATAIIEQLGEMADLARPLPSPERHIDRRYLDQARQMVR